VAAHRGGSRSGHNPGEPLAPKPAEATCLASVPRLQAAGGSGSRRLRPRPFDDRFLRRLGFFDTGNPK
jgi:hypothetical protein